MLIAKDREAPEPEHAPTHMRLSGGVIKQQPRLPSKVRDVKGVLHQEEDIYVIRGKLGGDKRPKHHTACEVPCCPCQVVDTFETQADLLALG